MKINTFAELFTHKIQSIYDAENQIIEAMPTVIDLASNRELKSSLQKHLDETITQKEKLETLCDMLNMEIEGPSNLAMEGIVDHAMELFSDNEPSPILDAAIIAAAQEIEHFEISTYTTAAEWAEQLQFTDAENILAEIMNEEKHSDEILSKLAEQFVNKNATQTSGQTPI